MMGRNNQNLQTSASFGNLLTIPSPHKSTMFPSVPALSRRTSIELRSTKELIERFI